MTFVHAPINLLILTFLSSPGDPPKDSGITLEFVTATRTQIVVQWRDFSEQAPRGYILERSLSPDFSGRSTMRLPAAPCIFSDTGFSPTDRRRFTSTQLKFGVQYFYRIRARYDDSSSENSNIVSGTLTSPVRGVEGDLWADVVLGQPDFAQNSPGPTLPNALHMGGGILYDTTATPQRLYFVDANHSRILGFAKSDRLPLSPDIVIGQPDFISSGPNREGTAQRYPDLNAPSASTLAFAHPDQLSIAEVVLTNQMAVDADHALYVADVKNHRVLKYEDPFATDTVADEVWGQPGFSTREPNHGGRSNRSLRFMTGHTSAGVAIDPHGSLWVADSGNCRILRFPVDPATGVIAKTADLVLGQTDFTTGRCDYHPTSIQITEEGVIYVAELQHRAGNPSRILVYEPPLTSGMPPTRIFAQNPVVRRPNYLFLDPQGRGLWVQNIEDWVSTTKLLNLSSGQEIFRIDTSQARGLGVDASGQVAIHILDKDVHLFKPPYTDRDRSFLFREGEVMTSRDFWQVKGVTTFGDQLIIGEAERLLIWNDALGVETYVPADDLWGQNSYDVNNRHAMHNIGYPTVDPQNRLWIFGYFRRGNAKMPGLKAFAYPLSRDSRPAKELWDTYPLVDRSGAVTLSRPPEWIKFDLADGGDQLWYPDQMHHRVLRINNIDGGNDSSRGPYVDVILGQRNHQDTELNQGGNLGPDTLNRPKCLCLDPRGNLYVSDNSGEGGTNRRLLVFDDGLFPDNLEYVLYAVPASRVLGTGGNFTTRGCVDEMCAPLEISFGPEGQMVGGMGAYNANDQRFPLVYLNPAKFDRPQMSLGDFSAVLNYSHIDADGNVYLGDYCWSRVLIYKKPFLHFDLLWHKTFRRGDANADGNANISDASYILNWLFLGGPELPCKAAGNANGDGGLNISDASSLLNFLFLGGPPPAEPFPKCGPGTLSSDQGNCKTPPQDCQE